MRPGYSFPLQSHHPRAGKEHNMSTDNSSLRVMFQTGAGGIVLAAEATALPAAAVVGLVIVAVLATAWLADRHLGKSGR